MARERGPDLNDFAAEHLVVEGRYDELKALIGHRAELYPEKYPEWHIPTEPSVDSTGGPALSSDGQIPVNRSTQNGEATGFVEEEKRNRVKLALLKGYIDDSFSHEKLRNGGLRIISNTRNTTVSQTFATIMSFYGEVFSAGTLVRVDLDSQTRTALEAPLEEVIDDKATAGAYFLARWAAKGLPNQMKFSKPEEADYVGIRLKEEYGFPFMKKSISEPAGTVTILSRNERIIPALRETEYIKDLPFIDAILPTPSLSPLEK